MPKKQVKPVQEPINSARKMILKSWPKFDEFTTEQQLEFITSFLSIWEENLELLNELPYARLTKQQRKQKGELKESIDAAPQLFTEIKAKQQQEEKSKFIIEKTLKMKEQQDAKEAKRKERVTKKKKELALVLKKPQWTNEEILWIVSDISFTSLKAATAEVLNEAQEIRNLSSWLNEETQKDLDEILNMITTSSINCRDKYESLLEDKDFMAEIIEKGVASVKNDILVLPQEESIAYVNCKKDLEAKQQQELKNLASKNYQQREAESLLKEEISVFSQTITMLNKVLGVNDSWFLKNIGLFNTNLLKLTDFLLLKINEISSLKLEATPWDEVKKVTIEEFTIAGPQPVVLPDPLYEEVTPSLLNELKKERKTSVLDPNNNIEKPIKSKESTTIHVQSF